MSDPETGAAEALDACWITDSQHVLAASYGFAVVGGMAKVTPARDAPKYVRLWGTEPQIKTDKPAWIISIKGEIVLPPDIQERDPTCVVVEGDAVWYATGASLIDGEWVPAAAPPKEPTATLPALVP
jgi:hypothetical protein